MAYIWYHKGEAAFLNAMLGGAGSAAGSGTPQVIPSGSGSVGSFGVGLGTRSGGVGTTKSDTITQIAEVGTTSAQGYARQGITRNQTDWPAATLVAGSYQTTASTEEFTFTGSPNPNAATMWFLAGNTTLNADNALLGADLAGGPHTYSNGEVQRVTPTVRLS
jgi:hypothetical protein